MKDCKKAETPQAQMTRTRNTPQTSSQHNGNGEPARRSDLTYLQRHHQQAQRDHRALKDAMERGTLSASDADPQMTHIARLERHESGHRAIRAHLHDSKREGRFTRYKSAVENALCSRCTNHPPIINMRDHAAPNELHNSTPADISTTGRLQQKTISPERAAYHISANIGRQGGAEPQASGHIFESTPDGTQNKVSSSMEPGPTPTKTIPKSIRGERQDSQDNSDFRRRRVMIQQQYTPASTQSVSSPRKEPIREVAPGVSMQVTSCCGICTVRSTLHGTGIARHRRQIKKCAATNA